MLSALEFEPLDWNLANAIAALSRKDSYELRLAIALVSKRCREGHVCVSLADVAGRPVSRTELGDAEVAIGASWPSLEDWTESLRDSGAVTQTEQLDPTRPLVLSGERLYLTRYYLHETGLLERLHQRVTGSLNIEEPARVRGIIDRLYSSLGPESERQRLATAIALASRLCIVTGGPGTGKTTAIVRLLAVLVEQALSNGQGVPRVLLLAPTGKAASRISDSIRESKTRLLTSEDVRQSIPDSATTIHRALGLGARPEYKGANRLVADVVVVDEASMVDLALMRRLFDACVSVPRLILLGDAEQLESVLAGSVLTELTANPHRGYCRKRAAELHTMTGLDVATHARESCDLDDCRIELTVSHRFRTDSAIGRLAQAVRAGRGDEAWQALISNDAQTRFIEIASNSASALRTIHDLAKTGYAALASATEPKDALAALQQFRILCAHRRGPFGVEQINESLSNAASLRHGPSPLGAVPFLVTENAPELLLYNGDVGVHCAASDSRQGRKAYLLGAADELRMYSISRLPAHELAFAMTVHKSQGSEVDRVLVVLPWAQSPLLTRELLYTAITRARIACTICGTKQAFLLACERKSHRCSGLRQGLPAAGKP